MIAKINESTTLTKHISCKWECKFDSKNVIRIKGGTTISVFVIIKVQKNIVSATKFTFGILQQLSGKMVNMQEVLLTIQKLYAV